MYVLVETKQLEKMRFRNKISEIGNNLKIIKIQVTKDSYPYNMKVNIINRVTEVFKTPKAKESAKLILT